MKRVRVAVSPPRAAVLAAALLLCAVPAVLMSSLPGYFGGLFIVFLCLVSFLYGLVVSRRLTCGELAGEASCRRGESVPMPLCISNGSRLVCVGCRAEFYTTDIFGRVRTTESVRFTMSPGETREFGFDVSFDHVGRYDVGLRSISVDGLLGVVSFVIERSFVKTVTVLPRCHELGRLSLSELVHNESIYANRVSHADSIDYSGVREYSIGDPIKLIHWNLSSHTAGYMTKLMESYGNNALTVIPCSLTSECDTEIMMEAYDGVCECCASLGMFARSRGIDAELLCPDGTGEARRYPLQSAEELSRLVSLIPEPEASDGCGTLENMLRRESARRYSAANMVICSSKLSEYAAKQIMELKRRRKNVVLFYILPHGAPEAPAAGKAIKTLRAADVELYILRSADELGGNAAS